MADISVELNKIEANGYIMQGHVELYTQLQKAMRLLKESGLSEEEISDFISDRSSAALKMLDAYGTYNK